MDLQGAPEVDMRRACLNEPARWRCPVTKKKNNLFCFKGRIIIVREESSFLHKYNNQNAREELQPLVLILVNKMKLRLIYMPRD